MLTELQPEQDSRMLDLGCGAGRHAKYLASKGFDVTGIDLALSSILSARKFEKSNLAFYQHDMLRPFGHEHFDYVFNFFTSFGYFMSAKDNDTVINNISRALKPGGTVVIDYLNTVYSEDHLVPEEEKEIDGVIYHITRWTSDTHFFKRINIDMGQPDGDPSYTEQVEKIPLDQFKRLFQSNGLSLQNVYGDYRLNDYDPKASPRLIMTAEKH